MVVDDALRVARRSRGVIERDRLPFVGRMLPVELRIAAGDKLFVILRTQPLASRVGGNDRKLVRIDERGARDQRQRREWRVIGFVPIEVAFVGAGHDAAQETPAVAGGGLSW